MGRWLSGASLTVDLLLVFLWCSDTWYIERNFSLGFQRKFSFICNILNWMLHIWTRFRVQDVYFLLSCLCFYHQIKLHKLWLPQYYIHHKFVLYKFRSCFKYLSASFLKSVIQEFILCICVCMYFRVGFLYYDML